MIKLLPKLGFAFLVLTTSSATLTSCKDKTKVETTTPEQQPAPPVEPPPAPVEITEDTALARGVDDAIKDFPTVKASINRGVITLTGTVKKDRQQTLMQSLQSLRPKKIERDQLVTN